MNMPLLFWASKETGESRYSLAAEAHIQQLARCIVRENGSTCHTYNFDPVSGIPIGPKSAQGYSHESTWSRGQAWAIYGFSLAYRYTGNTDFLRTARHCLAYWRHFLLPQGDAPWDFNAPRDEWLPVDSSAMSIATCGILELYLHSPEDKELLGLAELLAVRLLHAHMASSYHAQAFLLHGCVGPAYRKDSAEEKNRKYMFSNHSLIYGDYFLYESLLRLQQDNGIVLPWDFQ